MQKLQYMNKHWWIYNMFLSWDKSKLQTSWNMESSLDMIIKNGRLKSNNETYVIIYYKAHRDENDSQWSFISKYKIL